MYYEFYIDVFFVQGTARPWRALGGALAGAALISLFFWTAKEINTENMLIFSLGTTFVMVRLGCGLRKGKELLTGFLTCWGISFLLGGMLYTLPLQAGKGILIFFTITFTAYLILDTGIRLFKYLKGRGQKMELEGLLDTGNCLTDSNTGKPVCVMEMDRFSSMLEKKQRAALESFCGLNSTGGEDLGGLNPRFVFYTALGCEKGLLPVVTADRLVIFWEERKISIPQAAIGLSAAPLSPYRKFEMIISPKILDS